jgi:hypothetical protein
VDTALQSGLNKYDFEAMVVVASEKPVDGSSRLDRQSSPLDGQLKGRFPQAEEQGAHQVVEREGSTV